MRIEQATGEDCISIHALHEESDCNMIAQEPYLRFQSTLSMRRATETYGCDAILCEISIHALHEESDKSKDVAKAIAMHFNPRSP